MRQQKKPMGCFETVVFVGIFWLVGIGLLIGGGISYRRGTATQSWPTTNGVITSSQIYESHDDEGGVSYGLNATYDYTVDDRRYAGDRIKFVDYTSSRRYALDLQEKYARGTEVTVYYDPADPASSILEPGAGWVQYLLLGMGVCFSIVPLFSILSFFRRGFKIW